MMQTVVERPTWEEIWCSLILTYSLRSKDAQTQHACAIVDQNQHLVGIGYNGFPPGIDDATLPNTRPDKYDYIIHAEASAINNMIMTGKDLTAYITGKPCIECLKTLWSNGVRHLVCLDRKASKLEENEEYNQKWNKLFALMQDKGMTINIVPVNTQWLQKTVDKFS